MTKSSENESVRNACGRRYYADIMIQRPAPTMHCRIRAFIPSLIFLALAGCATMTSETRVETPAEHRHAEPGTYTSVPGQEPATVLELRAAPAPDQAEIVDGKSAATDERALAAKSFVRIGDGDYLGDSQAARAWAEKQAKTVGADKVYIYTPDASAPLHAVFYVRYRLPFGATFRELTAAEQETLGATGVQLGSIVGGTPASEANLLAGDFVLKFDGKPIKNKADFEESLRAHMGKRVTLTISRNGQSIDRLVRLGVLPTPLTQSGK
jgi:membrane-associated protease RseP (regulator of RpoE activity)